MRASRRASEGIGQRLEQQEQLLLTSRMLSVAEMTSVLAHELHQPLGAVVNLLTGLRMRLSRTAPHDPEALGALDQALDQARFASDIMVRMRDFVERRGPNMVPLDLGELVRRTIDLLDWELHRAAILLTCRIDGGLRVRGDAVMLQQVLANLLRNAIEAITATSESARSILLEVGPSDGQGVVAITDDGPGIGDAGPTELFAPFTSTKPNGVGVGLALCRSIMELHRGRLWFTPGRAGGAQVNIALPLTEPEVLS